jgi:hypothetical protein
VGEGTPAPAGQLEEEEEGRKCFFFSLPVVLVRLSRFVFAFLGLMIGSLT